MTWDDDDPERHQVTRRALTKKEIEENDFRAYIANTSSESEAGGEDEVSTLKMKDKKAARDKLRSLLLGGNGENILEGWGEEEGKGDDGDVDMEITFTPALSKKSGEETTLEKYQRKVNEKRKKRKEELKEKYKESKDKDEKLDDEFFEAGGDEGDDGVSLDKVKVTSNSKKKKKGSTNEEKQSQSGPRKDATADELALLVAPDNPTEEPKHFSLKSVVKAEKQKKRKKGKRGKVEEDNEAQEDFVMNVKDERFKALFEDHQFAIDPTNPQYVSLDVFIFGLFNG